MVITDDKSQVSGLTEVGRISSYFSAEKIQASNQYLERNCHIRLKKQAAVLEADMVLIKKKTFNKGYGETPSVKIEATAFKYQ
ncbi:MAG: hypothetical protein HC906_17075 [Bacteroidales bacterium]|nr:hypothetical protein [Bacteroidales bacterium]